MARKYLRIEQVRFEERLEVVVEAPDELLGLTVPPMLLQPLVENAVKQGMDAQALTITLTAALVDGALVVRVCNPGHLGPLDRGVVLRNLRDRLAVQPGDWCCGGCWPSTRTWRSWPRPGTWTRRPGPWTEPEPTWATWTG